MIAAVARDDVYHQEHISVRERLARVTSIIVRLNWMQRFRALWFGAMFVYLIPFVGIGTGYAFGGLKSTYGIQPYRILLSTFPHNFRAHGIILAAFGWIMVLVWVSLVSQYRRVIARLAFTLLVGSAIYSTWSFLAFAGAYWENHTYTAVMWWYFSFAILGTLLAALTPPFRGSGSDTQ